MIVYGMNFESEFHFLSYVSEFQLPNRGLMRIT